MLLTCFLHGLFCKWELLALRSELMAGKNEIMKVVMHSIIIIIIVELVETQMYMTFSNIIAKKGFGPIQ